MGELRIRQLRSENHISQKTLAKELYVSQQTVAKWEAGASTPNPETLSKIADYFDVSVDYLLGKTDIKKAPAHGEQGRDGFEPSYGDLDRLKFALFGGDSIEDIDDELMEDVKAYAKFKLQQKQKEKEKDK